VLTLAVLYTAGGRGGRDSRDRRGGRLWCHCI